MSEPVGTRVLGVDPGSCATGFAVVEAHGNRSRCLEHGVIRVPSELPLAVRLVRLHARLREVVERHAPTEMAIEEVFTAHNIRSALVLGQARGALLLAAADRCEVFEYSARAVKKAVVGYGQADKHQVAQMVKMLLGLPRIPSQDAADALAIALCHIHSRPARMRAAGSGR